MDLGVPTWLVVLLVTLFVLYMYFTWNFGVFKKLGIKGPTPWPLIGNLWPMMRRGIHIHDLEARKYGKVVGTFFGRRPLILIYDVDMLKQILVKEFHNFSSRLPVPIQESPLNKMLIMLQGEPWKRVRNVMTPTFSSGKLRKMNQQLNKSANSLIESLDEKARQNETFEFKQFCGTYTMDVIASTAFGLQINSHDDPNNQFVRMAKKIFMFSFSNPKTMMLFFFPFMLKPLAKLGITLFPTDCVQFFVKVIEQAIDERLKDEGSTKSTDFLQLLMNVDASEPDSEHHTDGQPTNSKPKDLNEKGLTHDELLAQSILFFFAGYETTANTLSLLAYSLAVHPECQGKLIKEIEGIMNGEEYVTYDIVQKMPYLDMCLSEVLRLYPAGPRTDRVALCDTTINGVFIPKGMAIGIPIYALHMDPEVWPEPQKFDPERFTAEAKESRNPYHYMPFSMGPRNCVGMRLALMELKIATVHILLKFEFVKCEETEIPLTIDKLSMRAANGVHIKVRRRCTTP